MKSNTNNSNNSSSNKKNSKNNKKAQKAANGNGKSPKFIEYAYPLKVKLFDLEAKKMIAIMHEDDAKEMGVRALERIDVINPKNNKNQIALIDTTTTMVSKGELGLFKDVQKEINTSNGAKINVMAVPLPKSVSIIRKKLKGEKLSEAEIRTIVEEIDANKIDDVEVSALMTAVYIHGFDQDETVSMTKALIDNGTKIKINRKIVLDKHSIGGTNGRATMIVVPIMAAAGYCMPKTSSRSITSAAGTADSMEVLCPVSLSIQKVKDISEKIGGVICWGGAMDLAPVDDKIIKIEHPLSLDPPGQVIASVMAKKGSVGATHVIIDLPVGPRVKVKNEDQAREMAKKFIEVGKKLGMKVNAVMTDGTQPIGAAVGPALEAKYVLEILEGKIFEDLAQKSCDLAGILLEMVGRARKGMGSELARQIIESGKALDKMKEIIKAQGGSILKSEQVQVGKYTAKVYSKQQGCITEIDNRFINDMARACGAPGDKGAGLMLNIVKGQKIKKGDLLYELYSDNKRKLELALKKSEKETGVTVRKLILGSITG